MDLLTTVADAILSDDLGNNFQLTPTKNNRKVFENLTNRPLSFTQSFSQLDSNSSIKSLLQGKICNLKCNEKTHCKKRKSSMKYGDENEAPSPKTPKNGHECFLSKKEKSPISPLSNLKLLTRIASMEEHRLIPSKTTLSDQNNIKLNKNIRRCYSDNATDKSNLKPPINNLKLKKYATSSELVKNVVDAPMIADKNSTFTHIVEGSRREKSLGLLCERFLEHFPIQVTCLETPRRLVIDDVALTLGTERRRVYDIVNILECLNMATRVQKNMYQWMGNQHLETTLARLKALAISWGIGENLTTPIDHTKVAKNGNGDNDGVVDKSEARKDKSLGVLCQKFMMLFLTSSPPHVLQFDTVLHLLLGKEGENFDKLRTRGRRIYDIANVLISLQLMKKVYESKSFMYIGPLVIASDLKEALLSDKQVRLRHSLLPPLNDYISDSCIQSPTENFERKGITPSNVPIIVEKKGRPRKLASEFVQSAVDKNSTGNDKAEKSKYERSKYSKENHQIEEATKCKSSSEDSYIFLSPVDQHLNKNNVNVGTKNIVMKNNDRIIFTSPAYQSSNNNSMKQNTQRLKILHSSAILQFPRLGSPRMALTFQNSKDLSPPMFTNKPPAVTLPQIQVTSRLQKVNVANNSVIPQSKLKDVKKPVYVVHKASRPVQTGTGLNPNGIFKVYSRQGREGKSISTPAYVVNNEATIPLPTVKNNCKVLTINSSFGKTMSSVLPFPNINLNTLAKSHYKTVIGSQSKISTFNPSSSVGNGAFHFVINSNKASPQIQTPSTSSVTQNKSPSFVKIFESSPDNSSTDSELESIFGDSFNFTRPKNLVGGISMNGKHC